ncbi:putative ABC transporter ATP-binding protein [compost metagenome]
MHRRPNLLILDEPTNHLDIDSREALEEALEEFPGTVLAVSHDRYFINRCFGKLWSIEDGRFYAFSGNYEYYKEKQAEKTAASGASAARSSETVAAGSNAGSPLKNDSRKGSPAPAPSSRKPLAAALWEQEIAAAEEQVSQIDAEMLEPGIASDALKLAELQLTRDAAQAKLDDLYTAWMNEAELI